jgi:hypothetical protein
MRRKPLKSRVFALTAMFTEQFLDKYQLFTPEQYP